MGDAFLVAHEALDRFPLEFSRDADGTVVEAFHGDTWFRGTAYAGPEPEPLPEAYAAYPGFYRNDSPWGPVLRVLARKGALVLQWPYESRRPGRRRPRCPLADGSFAVGAERDPRRMRFEGVTEDGKAPVIVLNNGRWYRSFER